MAVHINDISGTFHERPNLDKFKMYFIQKLKKPDQKKPMAKLNLKINNINSLNA